MKINPKSNLKLKSRKMFEVCMIFAIALIIGLFLAFRDFEAPVIILNTEDVNIELTDIPETEQEKKPPPPQAPSVPVESEDEEFLDNVTIEDTDFSFFDWDSAAPPPMRAGEETYPPFLPYENEPKPIGGIAAIEKLVVYPEMAIKAGIEGTVILKVYVSEKGIPTRCEVLKSMGNNGCDEAAIKAVMQIRFTPAMQQDRAIPFHVTIPIRFRIKKN
jgi:protein TonB